MSNIVLPKHNQNSNSILPYPEKNLTVENAALQTDYLDEIGNMLYNMATTKGKIKLLSAYKKALYIIDMNNGFVNFGAMANPEYNELVPKQEKLIRKFREEDELVNFILEWHDKSATEFLSYMTHCLADSPEAELIPQFQAEKDKDDTLLFYKNSINGMFNRRLQNTIIQLTNLKEVVFAGVCADLCVMDFVRSFARFLNEINRDAKLFVVKDSIDTFDAPGHDREEWMNISLKVMEQAGVEIVENFDHLEEREKSLGLHRL